MLKSSVPHNRLTIEKRFPCCEIVTGGAVDFEIIKLNTGKLYLINKFHSFLISNVRISGRRRRSFGLVCWPKPLGFYLRVESILFI